MFIVCTLFAVFLPVLQIFIRKGISIINSAAVIPPLPTQELGVRSVSLYLHSETVAMDCPSWLPWPAMYNFHGLMISMDCHAKLRSTIMHDYHSTVSMMNLNCPPPPSFFLNIIFNGAFYSVVRNTFFVLLAPKFSILQGTVFKFTFSTKFSVYCLNGTLVQAEMRLFKCPKCGFWPQQVSHL
jgi:hypothetical protein